MVAFTGDIIDGNSKPPQHAMEVLYGVAIDDDKPWAASLGNHDGLCSRLIISRYKTNTTRHKAYQTKQHHATRGVDALSGGGR